MTCICIHVRILWNLLSVYVICFTNSFFDPTEWEITPGHFVGLPTSRILATCSTKTIHVAWKVPFIWLEITVHVTWKIELCTLKSTIYWLGMYNVMSFNTTVCAEFHSHCLCQICWGNCEELECGTKKNWNLVRCLWGCVHSCATLGCLQYPCPHARFQLTTERGLPI